jgi:hypothetical protein
MARARRANAQRSFLAGPLPAASFHNNPHDNPDGLSQTLGTPWVLAGQKSIDFSNGFELAHDARQRRPIVMQLRFLHPALAIRAIEETEHLVERLLRVIEHVGKGASLPIFEKLLPGDGCCWHGSTLQKIQKSHLQILYVIKQVRATPN